MRAAKACAQPSCAHVRPCPIPGHEKVPWQGSTRRKRLPRGWPKLRAYILKRDPLCTQCRRAPSQEVHHLRGWQDNSEHALAGVCRACHASASGREGQAARVY